MSNRALDPLHSVSVAASAGTGKTWLLTARIVRLLLAGAPPGGILALTFTRKAAAEMQSRVNERLRALALGDEAAVAAQLRELELEPVPELLARARGLYETLLFAPVPLRATTLHAFCQDLVTRFALHTGTTPGFEVVEKPGELFGAAWQGLQRELHLRREHPAQSALDALIADGASEHQLNQIVTGFLVRRNDWRALTDNQPEPLAHLRAQLEKRFELDLEANVFAALDGPFVAQVRKFARYLEQAGGIGRFKAPAFVEALERPSSEHLQHLWKALFTDENKPRTFTMTQKALDRLGSASADDCLRLQARLVAVLEQVQEQNLRQRTVRRTLAAATLGDAALRCFDAELARRNTLSFDELEWRACRLLADPEAGAWVQYRLDARLDHLLVDEFQDTSDTQWRLLLPLLQEMSAGNERPRSAFIVGDGKQSIYGFRRANAALMAVARRTLTGDMGGHEQVLSQSRRSSWAVMNFVNALFAQPEAQLPDFAPHSTAHQALWGRVEAAPVVQAREREDETLAFRNPLTTPRPDPENDRARREGELIAARIKALVDARHDVGGRALAYGDVYILLRKRTHQQPLERALAAAGIPFVGASRGTLLDSIEARDLLALLRFLASPVRDVDLAHALRSPLFEIGDDDLVRLARGARQQGNWYRALLSDPHPALERARRLLPGWLQAARALPAHDLLDRILHEADAAARYQAALPPAQAVRVRANLGALAQLFLGVDAGRYPALPRVLRQLERSRVSSDHGPDEAPAGTHADAVRILTIHAAKGLEAPAVFIAQAAGGKKQEGSGWRVQWPAGAPAPQDFVLIGRKAERDSVSNALLAQQEQREQLEDLNLLYVACTRAKQFLHLSGFELRGEARNWLALAQGALRNLGAQDQEGHLALEFGRPAVAKVGAPVAEALAETDVRLTRPLTTLMPQRPAPSSTGETPEADAVRRGTAIHQLLQQLSEGRPENEALSAIGDTANARERSAWLAEAQAVLAAPQLAHFFNGQRYLRAWNEVPLLYRNAQGQLVNGVMDRLVDDGSCLWLLDYKTERGDPQTLQERYRPQMQAYIEGLRQLWPQRQLRAGLLLTASAQWMPLDIP